MVGIEDTGKNTLYLRLPSTLVANYTLKDEEDFEVEEKPLPPTFTQAMNKDTKITKTSFKKRKIHNPEENGTLAIPIIK